jgi:hypothetical protein
MEAKGNDMQAAQLIADVCVKLLALIPPGGTATFTMPRAPVNGQPSADVIIVTRPAQYMALQGQRSSDIIIPKFGIKP